MRPTFVLVSLLLALPPLAEAVTGPSPASASVAAAEPMASATSQGRGRASGARKRGGSAGRESTKPKKKRSIGGSRPLAGGLLGRGASSSGVFPAPSLESFVERAPAPSTSPPAVPEVVDEERLAEWFGVADYDTNEWVSYRESRQALEFDRGRFRHYDKDQDGRMGQQEFDFFYSDSMRRTGTFQPPLPPAGPSKAPPRTPEQLRNAYDTDLDGGLSLFELARVLADYRRSELEPSEVLRLVDSNRDERLDVEELAALSGVLYPIIPPTTVLAAEPAVQPTSLAELFDQVEPRGTEIGGTPYPPRIVGPMHPFRRLDLDGDGLVSATDLEELLRPMRVGIRPNAVLNTLDRDGDGQLSFDELGQAFIDFED